MAHVIFVCTGNICRSPMAEVILRERWKNAGFDGLTVSSMGIHGLESKPASSLAQQICAENGIDLSRHRSRPLVPDEIRDADQVLSMEGIHQEFLSLFFPQFTEKFALLGAWPEVPKRKNNIPDPMGGSIRVYKKAYTQISTHIDRIIPELSGELGKNS